MVLIELIRNTNATLKANGSAEKIVLMGPSMGGLISRYALAFMEKQLALNPTTLYGRRNGIIIAGFGYHLMDHI